VACRGRDLAEQKGPSVSVIGQVHAVVPDCAEPRSLAAFYRELLGLDTLYESATWVTIGAAGAM
jgi:catechol-2,3-dioxygenase